MAGDAAELGTADWRDAADEARGMLRIATGWQLEAARWRQVQDVLAGIEGAATAADTESLWHELARLGQFGQFRIGTRLGDAPKEPEKEPAPEEIRERINVLIYTLGPEDGQVPGGQDPDRSHGTSAR